MNKERKVIEPNPIVVFNDNVKWSEVEDLFQDFEGDIIITGDLILEKDSLITCDNIYVMGELYEDVGCANVRVEGNLYVEDAIDCCNITVNGSVICQYVGAFEINIAEDLYAKNGIDSCGHDINVGGDLVCEAEVEAADIMVLGKFYVSGSVEADSVWVS